VRSDYPSIDLRRLGTVLDAVGVRAADAKAIVEPGRR
jgi:hypothetical protein